MSIFRTTIRTLAQLLPQECFVCGQPCGTQALCTGCEADLPWLNGPLCPVCALPVRQEAVCGTCLSAPPQFDATTASFRYAHPAEHIVQALKYRHLLPLAEMLANALATRIVASGVDCILPLPLSSRRMRERGFNQAQEIARPLSRQLGIPLLSDAGTRRLDTAPQASLPWKARRANIRNAFECSVDLGGRTVAVVDDVMTTGATLNEFARVLKLHGAARVENWVAARTLPQIALRTGREG